MGVTRVGHDLATKKKINKNPDKSDLTAILGIRIISDLVKTTV